MDLDALRIDAAHDMPDGAVLACRVHRLEDDDDAVGVLGSQTHLVLGEQLDALCKELFQLRLADRVGPESEGRIEVSGQAHPASGLDAEAGRDFADELRSQIWHVGPPWVPNIDVRTTQSSTGA